LAIHIFRTHIAEIELRLLLIKLYQVDWSFLSGQSWSFCRCGSQQVQIFALFLRLEKSAKVKNLNCCRLRYNWTHRLRLNTQADGTHAARLLIMTWIAGADVEVGVVV